MRWLTKFRARSWEGLLFQLAGLAALVWFLLRVLQKPSRAAYPCQRAAFPLASAFLVSLLSGLTASAIVLRRFWGIAAVVVIAVLGLLLAQNMDATAQTSSAPANWTPSDPPNTPLGDAKGIFPGRVTWIRDLRATPWDGKTGKWWDENNIDQTVLDGMFARSVKALTSDSAESGAWTKLFRHFNTTHGRGDRGWQPGEQIAIKVNFNNTYAAADASNNIDQSPQGLRALLKQLTGPAGVAQKDIVVYDASVGWKQRAIPDRVYNPVHKDFPDVRWVDSRGQHGRQAPQWVANAITYSFPGVELGNSLPKCVVDATYLINMALLKGHEMAGVTLCAKNHFGSVMYPQKDHAKYVTPMKRDISDDSALVDLMGSPNLGGKTMLYIIDGLYGTQTNVNAVTDKDRWRRLFNGEWSASLFMSQDPVAIDSVGLDFLRSEFQGDLGFSGAKQFPKGSIVNSDNYLLEAARGANAKLGAYKPNGVAVGSLGVHEHWNNAQDKKYSRNLSPDGKGIELFSVPAQ